MQLKSDMVFLSAGETRDDGHVMFYDEAIRFMTRVEKKTTEKITAASNSLAMFTGLFWVTGNAIISEISHTEIQSRPLPALFSAIPLRRERKMKQTQLDGAIQVD